MQVILLRGTLEYKVRDLKIPLCYRQPLQVCVCVCVCVFYGNESLLITLSSFYFEIMDTSYPLLRINTFPLSLPPGNPH